MGRERGGIAVGILATIGAIVVILIVAGVACFNSAGARPAHGATRVERHHRHYRDHCRRDCDEWGGGSNGNSGGDYEGGRSGDNDQRGDHNCRNFCFYGIPVPGTGPEKAGFIPPNPGKIPHQIADFVKVVTDFVESVLRFAV